MDGVWVPIILFIVIGLCVSLGLFFRYKSRRELQITVRGAIDSGQALTAEALVDLTAAAYPPRSDLRRGVLWVAVGLAFVIFAFTAGGIEDGDEAVMPLLGIASFPLLVGIAYLILNKLNDGRAAELP